MCFMGSILIELSLLAHLMATVHHCGQLLYLQCSKKFMYENADLQRMIAYMYMYFSLH